MSKVLLAFNNIHDQYISEAIECPKFRPLPVRLKLVAAAACLFLILLGLFMMQDQQDQGGSVMRPQYIYQVGEKITSYYGTIQHMGFDDRSATFKIKSNRQWTYGFDVSAVDYIGDNFCLRYMATTSENRIFGSQFEDVLTNVLVIYVDGVRCSSITIPADGKEHEVKIDFSYFLEAGYEVDYSCYWNEFGTFTLWRK